MERNYYAIIPASVRYSENVCPNAKLLFGEITALCNEKGYCWASNDYFKALYKVSTRSISKWIKELESANFITSSFQKEKGQKFPRRIIMLTYTSEFEAWRNGKVVKSHRRNIP